MKRRLAHDDRAGRRAPLWRMAGTASAGGWPRAGLSGLEFGASRTVGAKKTNARVRFADLGARLGEDHDPSGGLRTPDSSACRYELET